MPAGSFTETFTGTVFVPTEATVTCSDLPTLLLVEEEAERSETFVRFLVDFVVPKKVLFAAVGDGVGVGVAVADGVGEGEGVGVTVGVGVGVAVGVGVGVTTGVGVGVGVTTGADAFEKVTTQRVVPGKKAPLSIVKVSVAISPKYSR